MKIIAKLNNFFLPSILLFHTVLIFVRGYFLSPEFTLYPYLTSHGFLPYRDIVDQHFPTLLFGPFSLPGILTTNPWPLLGVFVAVLCLTDILLYASLIRFKIKQPLAWLVLFIVSSVYFSGYVLWLETIVNLLIALWLFLSFSKNNLRRFASGFFLSQIILLRPTITPALIIIFFSFSSFSWSMLFGGVVGIAIPALFIIKQGLFSDFFRLAILFNKEIYPVEALLLPTLKQIATLLFWLFPVIYSVIKNKKYLSLVTLIFLLALAYPRFGYEHLQPMILIAVIFWALINGKPKFSVYVFIVLFFCLNLVSAVRHPYGNFYYTPEIQNDVEPIKNLTFQEVYFLGVPDILYPLSGKTPPNFTYVPSLPWYLHQKNFQDKIISSLEYSKPAILIDFGAEVDRKNIVIESQKVIEYIKMNYTKGENIGNYQLFLPTL